MPFGETLTTGNLSVQGQRSSTGVHGAP